MRVIYHIRLLATLAALVSIPACVTSPMNKQEAADWFAKYHSMVRWMGYEGSDQNCHYFIARVMDDWAFIKIKKEDLTVLDERPRSRTSGAPICYYLVDPARNYEKIEP